MEYDFIDRINNMHYQLYKLEEKIIEHTKNSINIHEQENGKLIQRSMDDAVIINMSSTQFFTLLHDICCESGLARITPIISTNTITKKKIEVAAGKLMPGISSIAVTKQLDDTGKRAKGICQRVLLLTKALAGKQYLNRYKKAKTTQANKRNSGIRTNLQRLL